MRSSSNISSTLNKKRRKIFVRRMILLGILALLLIIATLFGLRSDKIKIKSILVTGNASVSQDHILDIVHREADKKYLWFIPRDNFFLLKRGTIENDIVKDIQKIKTASVSFTSMDTLTVSVAEREQQSFWCVSVGDCYAMDANGLIFEAASSTHSTSTQIYFGLITDTDPIGKFYFTGHFIDAAKFFQTLIGMNLSPVSFSAVDEDEYEINLHFGGKILVNSKKTFDQDINDLQAVIQNGYIKTDTVSLSKVKYIDLRYGNKAVLKFN